MTYFMTPKVNLTSDLDLGYDPKRSRGHKEVAMTYFMTPKGHKVIRGRRDLLYDPKGHGDLCGRFDLVYDPKKVTGSLEVDVTYFMTPKVTVTFVVGLT